MDMTENVKKKYEVDNGQILMDRVQDITLKEEYVTYF